MSLISQRLQRFKLIKKVITIEQDDLYQRLASLKTLIDKKNASISRFELFLHEYQNKLLEKNSLDGMSFVNFQSFMDQIMKVLHKEREDLHSLQQKDETLKLELMKKTHQIDALDNTIVRLSKA